MTSPRHQTQTTGHRYALKRLSSYIDGQLSDHERARIAAHLDTCADCREELRTLRWTQNLTRQMPVMPVPRSFILRQADLEARHIAQPRSRLVPTLARLQAAAAIVAVMLVLIVAGDAFVGRGLPIGRSGGALSMDAASPETATVAIAGVPEAMQAPPVEERKLAPDSQQIEPMVVPSETPSSAAAAEEATASPTTAATREPSSTSTTRPTRTPTKAGHSSDVTSTQSTPTPMPTATATTAPTHTLTAEPTQTPTPTATKAPVSMIAPKAPTTITPASESQEGALAPGAVMQEEAKIEEPGAEEEQTDLFERERPWRGWRIAQIGLGAVLFGLLIAIVWLRRWGRLN